VRNTQGTPKRRKMKEKVEPVSPASDMPSAPFPRSVTDSLPCVIFRLHCTDSRLPPVFSSISEQARTVLGLDPAALALDSSVFFDCIVPADMTRVRQGMRAAFDQNGHWLDQFRLQLEGGERWFEVNASVQIVQGAGAVADGFLTDITGRQLLVRDTQLLSERDRFVFDAAPQPIIIVDEAGNTKAVNRAFVETFGYRADEIPDRASRIGKLVADKSSRGRLLSEYLDGIRRFEQTGVLPQPIVAQVHCKDGTSRTVELRTNPGAGESIAILTDITDSIHRENEHRRIAADRDELRAELGLRSNVLPIALVVGDATDALTTRDWNPAAERIFGYTREEIVGTSPYDSIIPPESHEFVHDVIRRVLETPGTVTVIGRNRTKDGRMLSCEWCCTAVRDAHGTALHVVSIVQDVTERLIADEKHRLWTSVLEQSGEGIMICDPQRRILVVNKAFERLTGFSAAEAVGQSPAILRSGRQDTEFYAQLWRELTATGHWAGEIWNRRKNGELYIEWLSLSMVNDAHGAASHYVGMFSDITVRKQAEDQVRRLAHYDVLTGLPNRSLLLDRLDQLIEISRRDTHKVGVMFIDLDRFKEVNDSLGHDAGDLLLQTIASRIIHILRRSDTVGRMGGDEFVVLLPELANSVDAAVTAQKLLDEVSAPLLLNEQQLSITASIGICVFPDDGTTVSELIRNADAAMYRAKSSGRDGYQFYTRELNVSALEKLRTESALRLGIERQELVLHYQAQIDLRTGLIVGAEALVRWNRPDVGLTLPGHFIPLAEERGLIVAIDNWVVREAIRQAHAWDRAGLPPICIAVNVSAGEFHSKGFIDSVKRAIADHPIDPARFEFELTEGVAVHDVEGTTARLLELHGLGFRLSLDYFGTGYSSLNHLRHFPIDRIKIDRSFVSELSGDGPDALRTVRAIINLAKSYSMKVIAEGVETQEQLAALRSEQCDEFQGYLASKPLPREQFEQLLRRWTPLAEASVAG
jgi:diguanylate cyclase (GGDEF)-like protein/PAS domain S-box-containing protein